MAAVAPEVPVLRESGPPKSRSAQADLELIGNVEQSLNVLSGKWKVHLLFFMARGVRRHSRLLECLPGASKKVMTDSLRALERDGIVLREVFAEVPVRVEYSLTPLGWSMSEPLIALSEWGNTHAPEVANARASRARRASEDGRFSPRSDTGRSRGSLDAAQPRSRPIVGFRRPDQVDPIVPAADLELSDDDVAELEGR